jgi:hypothetical protein
MVMIVDDERALVAVAELTLAQIGFKPAGFGSKFERRRAAGVSRATEALRPRVNRRANARLVGPEFTREMGSCEQTFRSF